MKPINEEPLQKNHRQNLSLLRNQGPLQQTAAYLASEWLGINVNKADYALSIICSACKTCKTYADKLHGMKNLSTAQAFTGCSKDTGLQLVTSGIRDMQSSYFVAPDEMPLSKYPHILQLEEKLLLTMLERNWANRWRKSCLVWISSVCSQVVL